MNPFVPVVNALGEPLKNLFKAVTKVVDDVHTSDEERERAKLALSEAQAAFSLQMASVASQEAHQRAETIRAEVNSGGWLARSWRPLSALAFVGIVLYNHFLALLLGLQRTDIPNEMWDLITLMVGGYTFTRTAEKILPNLLSRKASP